MCIWQSFGQTPNCTALSTPVSFSTDVPLDVVFEWVDAVGAESYILIVGTNLGGNDILDGVDVGGLTSYQLPNNLPPGQDIFVKIIPINAAGANRLCGTVKFSTTTIPVPDCTNFIAPANGSVNNEPDTLIEWSSSPNATGYRITIGSQPGGNDIVDDLNVMNTTSYVHSNGFDFVTDIYTTITPYNDSGGNYNCVENRFSIGSAPIPECSEMTFPVNDEEDVAVHTVIEWSSSPSATGYRITIGSKPGGNDIVDDLDVMNTTSYRPNLFLKLETTFYVKITPYNSFGDNDSCTEYSFITSDREVKCADIVFPTDLAINISVDATIEWSPAIGATGYAISLGTASGRTNIIANLDLQNITTYQHPGGFDELTTIFVAIRPHNNSISTFDCYEFQFTTATAVVPNCSQITNPQDDNELINVDSEITWVKVDEATGYFLTIIKDEPDGEIIVDNMPIGNVTKYKPLDLEPRTHYFVAVVPYNLKGSAKNCETISFTTGDSLVAPECTEWVSPENGATKIAQDLVFEWNAVPGADGFILSIGSTPNGTDILDNEDVGDETVYDLPENLPNGATIYVTINTYSGNYYSEDCQLISFKIEDEEPEQEELKIKVPRFFTPNNDRFNDLWTVYSTEEITIERIFVFDNYGKLIKQLADGQGWDGTYNSVSAVPNSYWYSIEFVDAPSIRGYFLLKR